jgi:hypothetical protein
MSAAKSEKGRHTTGCIVAACRMTTPARGGKAAKQRKEPVVSVK